MEEWEEGELVEEWEEGELHIGKGEGIQKFRFTQDFSYMQGRGYTEMLAGGGATQRCWQGEAWQHDKKGSRFNYTTSDNRKKEWSVSGSGYRRHGCGQSGIHSVLFLFL